MRTLAPHGVRTRCDVLLAGESQLIGGRAVTTPERTAFDIGRRGAVRSAVAQLDSLARATGFKVDDVLELAKRHPARADCGDSRSRWIWSIRVHSLPGRATHDWC